MSHGLDPTRLDSTRLDIDFGFGSKDGVPGFTLQIRGRVGCRGVDPAFAV
jgi:hypothetical protein